MGVPHRTLTARRARTTTRIAVGTALYGLEKAGELLDVVANRAELAALLPGSDPGGSARPPHESTTPTSAVGAAPTTELDASNVHARSRRRAIVLGAVFELEDRALAATERSSRAGASVFDLAWRTGRVITPGLLRQRLEEGLEQLTARGGAEEVLSRQEAGAAVNLLVEQGTGGPWLVETMNDVVGRVLGPLLDNVLPLVVERLRENPEPIKELVRDQSVTIAGEVAETVRSGAATADSSLERIARRLTFRRPRAELPPASPES